MTLTVTCPHCCAARPLTRPALLPAPVKCRACRRCFYADGPMAQLLGKCHCRVTHFLRLVRITQQPESHGTKSHAPRFWILAVKIAVVAVGRKLLVRCWAMLRKQTEWCTELSVA